MTVPGECQARQDPRVTEALMAWLVCLGRKGTGVSPAPTAPPGLLERMGRGEMMEKLDPEVSLENLDPEDFWAPRDPQDPRGHRVWLAWMDKQVPKGMWALRASPAPQDSRGTPGLRVSQVLKEPSVPQERKALWANLASLECLELMGPRVTLARKVLLERRAVRVPQVLRAPLVTQDPEESREQMEFVA